MSGKRKSTTVGPVVLLATIAVLVVAAMSAAEAGPTVKEPTTLAESELLPPDGGSTALVLEPPGDSVPAVSADSAVKEAVSRFDVPDDATVNPQVALLTDPNYRPVTPDGDPTGPPFWEKLPVWVVTIDGLCFGQEGGGAPLTDEATTDQGNAGAAACPNTEAIVFIDANSGEYLMDFSYR